MDDEEGQPLMSNNKSQSYLILISHLSNHICVLFQNFKLVCNRNVLVVWLMQSGRAICVYCIVFKVTIRKTNVWIHRAIQSNACLTVHLI